METDSIKIGSFKDLNAWKKGHELVLFVYLLTKNFPREEKFSLIDQMRRAVVSVTSNIAEGFARFSYPDKIRFYYIAQGSLIELSNQLLISKDLNYLSGEDFKKADDLLTTVHKLTNGLIKGARAIRSS